MSDNKVVQRCLLELTKKPYLDFSEFMNLALYAEHDGYYMRPQSPLGASGDFITAPILSPIFSKAIAAWLEDQGVDSVLEVGAGQGQLAMGVIASMPALKEYIAVDKNTKTLMGLDIENGKSIKPTVRSSMPKEWSGGLIANELFDAFPVRRFCWEAKNGLKEFVVCEKNGQLHMMLQKTIDVEEMWPRISQCLKDKDGPYIFEHCFEIETWFDQIAGFSGPILLIDYGYELHEYFHPDRTMGALMCFQQHQVVPFSLSSAGMVDMTTAVNWSWVIEVAQQRGFSVECFGPQADFLLEYASFENTSPQQVKTLLMPEEMGQYVKILSLKKQQ